MAKSQNDHSKQAPSGWYMQANINCFHGLEKGNFLLIFLGPVCMPHNKNYGQAKKTSGRAPSSQQKRLEQVAKEQEQLLQGYRTILKEAPETIQTTVAGRARALTDNLKNQLSKADIDYISKGNSCQADRYLAIFRHAALIDDKTPEQMMDYMVEIYTLAIRQIFRDLPEYYQSSVEKKTKEIREAFPAAAIPEKFSPEQDQLAWLLCCELILLACREENNWEIAHRLQLILEIPVETVSARPGKARVHLPAGIFYNLCAKAMDGVRTADDVAGMLNLIQNFCPAPYEERARSLLMQLSELIIKTQFSLMEQCSKDINQMSVMLPEINRLEELKNQCSELLNR